MNQRIDIEAVTRDGTPLRPVIERTTAARIAERDGRVCCLTGLGDSFWDPLLVYPIFPDITCKIDTAVMSEMLCAFLDPQLLDWILSEEGSQRSRDGGYWLVRRSAAAAFAKGYFRVDFNRKPKVCWTLHRFFRPKCVLSERNKSATGKTVPCANTWFSTTSWLIT